MALVFEIFGYWDMAEWLKASNYHPEHTGGGSNLKGSKIGMVLGQPCLARDTALALYSGATIILPTSPVTHMVRASNATNKQWKEVVGVSLYLSP